MKENSIQMFKGKRTLKIINAHGNVFFIKSSLITSIEVPKYGSCIKINMGSDLSYEINNLSKETLDEFRNYLWIW